LLDFKSDLLDLKAKRKHLQKKYGKISEVSSKAVVFSVDFAPAILTLDCLAWMQIFKAKP
jgi:hypothetical protein